MSWIDIFKGRREEPPEPALRLENYPAYQAPYPQRAESLIVQHAQANLDYLLANRAQRLVIVTEYLMGVGVDPRSALRSEDLEPFLQDLKAWVLRDWRRLYDPEIARPEVWVSTSRSGDELIYSMLMDLSLLLAEIIVVRRPDYVWSLDLDPRNGRRKLVSYKRPVLQVQPEGAYPVEALYDVEDIVVGQYHKGRLDDVVFAGLYALDRLVREPLERNFS